MKRKILVVDDDASIRTMVRTVLERAGYEVTTARNGCEAIVLIAESDYDVVLLDVMMPKLDGLEVVDELRKSNSPV
ncbi:MAG: response regulator transcription factor, partial [Thermoanaerobaculia bacterium]